MLLTIYFLIGLFLTLCVFLSDQDTGERTSLRMYITIITLWPGLIILGAIANALDD